MKPSNAIIEGTGMNGIKRTGGQHYVDARLQRQDKQALYIITQSEGHQDGKKRGMSEIEEEMFFFHKYSKEETTVNIFYTSKLFQ